MTMEKTFWLTCFGTLLAIPINVWLFKILWNLVVPNVMGWHVISYKQAFLLFLAYWSMHGIVRFVYRRNTLTKNDAKTTRGV